MEDTSTCREQYRMKFIFYADDGSSTANSPGTAAVASPRSKTYVVCVRMCNTEPKPLTKHNLQVLSLSIPNLYTRIIGLPKPFAFHKAFVHWEALSKEPQVPPISTPRPSSSSSSKLCGLFQYDLSPVGARQELLTSKTPPPPAKAKNEGPPSTSSGLKATGDQPSDWLQCDGSFIPDTSIKEWTMVSYQGEGYTRCISPLAYTDDAGDIIGRCNVTDYTDYGQPVFSVDVDFLQRKSGTGSDDTGGAVAVATAETPPSGAKTPRAKRQVSTSKRRSSGSRVSTPTRSPIRI